MALELANIIFGMKLRQARTEAGFNLTNFAKLCELSPSYVTEIEKGRKYPRADKIMRMADVLGKEYDELVSIKLASSLASLESALSSSVMRRFPFEEFGLEAGDLVTLLTRRPDRASALVHAILEMSRHYALSEEDFLRAALRSYQEIYENYFPELEEAAVNFTNEFGDQYGFGEDSPIGLSQLKAILSTTYHYALDDSTLAKKEALKHYRAVSVPAKQPKLFINDTLYSRQVRFVLARELGYRYLGLKERSFTSPPERIESFEQLLNDFKAAYFGGVLLMPRNNMIADIQALFNMPEWQPAPLVNMLKKYDVTPEMLLYRFSELIPQFFGMKLHFLRFHHTTDSKNYTLAKQLNMNQLLVPSGIGLHEHHCRRWLSVRLLREAEEMKRPSRPEEMPVGVQLSEFIESQDCFLCLGFARQLVLDRNTYSSVIVGFRVDGDLKNQIQFMNDSAIPRVLINETCERCHLTAEQCDLRAAAPTILQANQAERERKLAINQLY